MNACHDATIPVAVTFLLTTTIIGFIFTWLYLTEGSWKQRWKALWDREPGS